MVTRVHVRDRARFQGWLPWPVALSLVLFIAGLIPVRAQAGITLVQHTSKDAGITLSSSLAFPANNTAGNWIGVVIRAGHSSQVFTVSDTRGNSYHQAVQLNQTLDAPNGETLAIFYAENIAAGGNTVTVSESLANNTLRFAILEYSGVAASNSIDVTAAAQGSGTTLNSGPATTTVGGDLILGEVTTADGLTFTAGSGYNIEDRVPAAPNTKLITEDAVQVAAGAVSVGATLSNSDNGGALLAAFKAASGTLPPYVSSLSPTSGPVGTSVTIAGANFGGSQGTSTVTFNGVSAGTASNWTAASITVLVPTGATTGNVIVTVGGVASNAVPFTVPPPPPTITSLTPNNGPVGTSVTIAGANFGSSQGTSTVTIGGIPTQPSSWNATSIVVAVPPSGAAGSVAVVVTVGGIQSSGVSFTITPSILSLNPTSGPGGIAVTITGYGFGTTQGTSTVTIGGTPTQPSSWSAGSIVVPVPNIGTAGIVGVVVTVGGFTSNSVNFTVTPAIVMLNPGSGPVGTAVIISGTNFGPVQNSSAVTFGGGVVGTPTSWSTTSIVVPVPTGAMTGNVVVTVSGQASNGDNFTVPVPPPNISSVRPTSGPVGTSFTITGSSFGASQGTSTVTVGGAQATPTSWSDTTIVATIPTGASGVTAANLYVTVANQVSGTFSFTITPSIASLSPNSGPVGSSLTITGSNFGASQGSSTVTLNGVAATPTNWSATSITVTVPTGATSGAVVVTVGGFASNGVTFTVTPPPNVASLTPNSGPVGTAVTIAGSNFGPSQGTSTVTFNGVSATPTSWSQTSIVVAVPNGATSGSVVVSVSGVASNGVAFSVASPGPSISALSPNSGRVGTSVTITGSNFGASQGTSAVTFNGITATPSSWSGTSIVVPVPSGATTTGNVVVTVGGVASNGVLFTVVPSISFLSQTSGPAGTSIGIYGTGFGNAQGSSTVSFSGTAVTQVNWTATILTVVVPSFNTPNVTAVVVTVGSQASNSVNFTVTPGVSNINPSSGPVGTSVTITGSAFGISQGTSSVTIGGLAATPTSWSATTIVAPVPNAALTGFNNVLVTVGGFSSANGSATFTVTPAITSLSSAFGPVGTSVTLTGTSFGASQGTSTVTFNGASAGTATSWSTSSVTVNVPTGATSGNVIVNVGGVQSNGVGFTVPPNITSLSPTSGPAGTAVTITGTGFGVSQGSSSVTFNGTSAGTATSWSATTIVVNVPTGTSSGSVLVIVSGLGSNAMAFTIPTSITANAGTTPQSAAVSAAFTNAPAVTVKDAGSNPVSGVSVTFTAPGSGASGTFSNSTATITVATNASGVASAPFTANTTAGGPYTVTATATGLTTVNFSLTNNAGAPSTMTANAGTTPQSATVSTAFATPLAVTVKDASSNPVSGVNVTFTAPGSGASGVFSNSTATITVATNASGVASAPFTANATTGGPYAVTAAATGLTTVNFSLTNTVGTPTSMTANAGTTPQSATISTPFANALAVTVKDAGSNPVSGVNVTFTAPGSGASGVFSNSTGTITIATNASGIASASFTANATAGGPYTVTAVATGLTTVNFSLTNTAGAPATMTANAGTTPQSATINTAFANALAVTVKDAGSNPVSGVNVTFTAPGAGASGVFSNSTATITVATNASGVAMAPFTANTTAGGPYTVTAAASGLTTVNFSLTNLGNPPPSITSLSPTLGPVGTAVTIAGANFGGSQGTSTVTFSGVSAGTASSWSASSITVIVPSVATTGNVVVTVGGQTSNGSNFTVTVPAAPIALVQHTSKDAGTTTASSLAFQSNNTAGNWIAVVVRAGRSGEVFTVSDSLHNAYRMAAQLNVTVDTPNGDTLGLFYAENIAGGANTVTMSDTISGTLRFAIFEYSGVSPANSLDAASTNQGTSNLPNSSNAATTANGDLLLGALTTANPATFTAGSGYKIEEFVPAAPNSKLIAEDQIQSAAGVTSAGATLSASDHWGATLAAFKAASSTAAASPTVTSLNPTFGPVGTVVTISGTNFGASPGTSTIVFNGVVATPTSWSATSITARVPAGATTGTVVVTVGGVASNGVTFAVVSQPPSITGLSPSSAVAGSGPLTLMVTGTNFVLSSTVQWNGTARSTAFVSAMQLQATITAADVANAGIAIVTVTNVSAGGPVSGTSTFFIGTNGGNNFAATVVNQAAQDIVYDPKNQLFYLSVPGTAATGPNTISVLDPTTGMIPAPQPAGTNPNVLAISDDSQYLYAGIDGASSVQRFLLPSLAKDVSYGLGSGFLGPYFALDLQVAPGAPHTTAVSLGNSGVSPAAQGGVTIFDDASPRATTAPGNITLFDSLQWGADATALFAANYESSGFDFYMLTVSSSGVSLARDFANTFSSYSNRIHFDPGTKLVYADDGHVINPVTGQSVGQFIAAGPMVPDSTLNLAFFAKIGNGGTVTIQSFDLTHFTPVSSITVSGVNGLPKRLIRWGQNGLAFNTDAGQIVLIGGNFVH